MIVISSYLNVIEFYLVGRLSVCRRIRVHNIEGNHFILGMEIAPRSKCAAFNIIYCASLKLRIMT